MSALGQRESVRLTVSTLDSLSTHREKLVLYFSCEILIHLYLMKINYVFDLFTYLDFWCRDLWNKIKFEYILNSFKIHETYFTYFEKTDFTRFFKTGCWIYSKHWFHSFQNVDFTHLETLSLISEKLFHSIFK